MAQLALHRFKSVVNRFLERFVGTVVHPLLLGHKLVPGFHGDIDAATVRISLVMRVICLLDRDITPIDVVAKFLEPSCIIQNEIVDLGRFFQTPIRDLNRQLHDYPYYSALAVERNKNVRESTNIPESNLLQRPKMRHQFRRFRFHEIGFHVLDDPAAHRRR